MAHLYLILCSLNPVRRQIKKKRNVCRAKHTPRIQWSHVMFRQRQEEWMLLPQVQYVFSPFFTVSYIKLSAMLSSRLLRRLPIIWSRRPLSLVRQIEERRPLSVANCLPQQFDPKLAMQFPNQEVCTLLAASSHQRRQIWSG